MLIVKQWVWITYAGRFQRLDAAFFAISLRRRFESFFARAGPPFFPIKDAADEI